MSRAAGIMYMIDAVGEQNGQSGLQEEAMRELRYYRKEINQAIEPPYLDATFANRIAAGFDYSLTSTNV